MKKRAKWVNFVSKTDETQEILKTNFYEETINAENGKIVTVMSSNQLVQIEIENTNPSLEGNYAICSLSIDDARDLLIMIGKAIQDLEEN